MKKCGAQPRSFPPPLFFRFSLCTSNRPSLITRGPSYLLLLSCCPGTHLRACFSKPIVPSFELAFLVNMLTVVTFSCPYLLSVSVYGATFFFLVFETHQDWQNHHCRIRVSIWSRKERKTRGFFHRPFFLRGYMMLPKVLSRISHITQISGFFLHPNSHVLGLACLEASVTGVLLPSSALNAHGTPWERRKALLLARQAEKKALPAAGSCAELAIIAEHHPRNNHSSGSSPAKNFSNCIQTK